jgi:hypothetical protein
VSVVGIRRTVAERRRARLSLVRTYDERLSPPAGLWLGVWVFALALGLSFYVALGPVAGLLAFGVPAVSLSLVLARTTAVVRVEDGHLVAGAARIPVEALGPVAVLDAEEARRVRGPQSDPAAYHLIRGWVPGGVLAEVIDPGDPTPYWFVATRHPEGLRAAVEAARAC